VTALSDLKAQLNIVDATDDLLLTRKIAAAEGMVTNDIGSADPVDYDTAVAPLQEAIMMFAAHLYENREAVIVGASAQTLPLGYAELIEPYRAWVF
jgi:uncharacterized phage protein (predicted DNA packaging)